MPFTSNSDDFETTRYIGQKVDRKPIKRSFYNRTRFGAMPIELVWLLDLWMSELVMQHSGSISTYDTKRFFKFCETRFWNGPLINATKTSKMANMTFFIYSVSGFRVLIQAYYASKITNMCIFHILFRNIQHYEAYLYGWPCSDLYPGLHLYILVSCE